MRLSTLRVRSKTNLTISWSASSSCSPCCFSSRGRKPPGSQQRCCAKRWSPAQAHEGGTQGCAAALLALKRYEITLYEALLRWSEQCELEEAIGDIRRSIAEELVQASILSDLAFIEEGEVPGTAVGRTGRACSDRSSQLRDRLTQLEQSRPSEAGSSVGLGWPIRLFREGEERPNR